MNRFAFVFVTSLFYQLAFGQSVDKNKAIEIAKENRLKQGIEAPVIERKDSVWVIKNLLCDDTENYYQVIEVDANTGEVKLAGGSVEMSIVVGGQSKKTKIKNPENWDDIPVKNPDKKPYLLKTPDIGRECNPDVSPNNQFIAFQYKNRRIGMININGRKFKPVCSDCMQPQWIDNVWVAYLNYRNQIVKKNIKTNEEKVLTETSIIDYQISPDRKWIAYTSSEVWHAQKESSEAPVIFASVNGQDQDLCLLSMDGKIKRYITKINKYVHNPCWSENGDTLFFNIEQATYFAARLERDAINYLPLKKLDQIALTDYRKVVNGLFPFKHKCKIYAIDENTVTPAYLLNENPGRYGDLVFTHDLKYLVFTKQTFKNSDKELWIQKLD